MANGGTITLSPFRADNAAGLFAHGGVEVPGPSRSLRSGTTSTSPSPPKEVIYLCLAAVAHPDEDEPYTRLKEDHLQQAFSDKVPEN
jgi:hypothetical protein